MTSAAQRAKEIAERITARIGFVIDGVVSRSIAAELEPEIQARMDAEERRAETVAMCAELKARAERAEAAAASWKGRYAALRSPVTMRRRKSEESSRMSKAARGPRQ